MPQVIAAVVHSQRCFCEKTSAADALIVGAQRRLRCANLCNVKALEPVGVCNWVPNFAGDHLWRRHLRNLPKFADCSWSAEFAL